MNPDLTIEYFYVCPSTQHFHKVVTGSKGDEYEVTYGYQPTGNYQYGWSCTCKAFHYHPEVECKHIKTAELSRCNWNESAYYGSSEPKPIDGKCPNCGQALEIIKVAV